ncbi:MAG: PH domain-containing protein [Candidatus Nanohalobium sp.]
MNKLKKKVLVPWMAGAVLTSIVLTGLAAAAQLILEGFSMANTGAFLVLTTAILLIYTVFRYRNWGFEMRDDYLYLERGVLKKVNTKVPYVRVQHIDTQRGPIYRIFGLSKLVVYTAGSRGADVGIPGLLPEDADDIQEELRKVAVESEEEFGDAV